jgi:DNA-binding transcriptional MerR regulator
MPENKPTNITLCLSVSPQELDAAKIAAQHLVHHMRRLNQPIKVNAKILKSDPLALTDTTPLAILSMHASLDQTSGSIQHLRQRWADQIKALQNDGMACVICNLFRHVQERKPGQSHALSERILELNLLAIDLSQQTGASLADIDRALSQYGGQPLQADYQLNSPLAVQLAGHTLARTLLLDTLQDTLNMDVLDQAARLMGSTSAYIDFMLKNTANT